MMDILCGETEETKVKVNVRSRNGCTSSLRPWMGEADSLQSLGWVGVLLSLDLPSAQRRLKCCQWSAAALELSVWGLRFGVFSELPPHPSLPQAPPACAAAGASPLGGTSIAGAVCGAGLLVGAVGFPLPLVQPQSQAGPFWGLGGGAFSEFLLFPGAAVCCSVSVGSLGLESFLPFRSSR